MSDYIDNVVLKLKRKYSKDELVARILKEQSQLQIEIGTLRSERDELQYKLDKFLKLDNDAKSRYCQTLYVRNMKNELKSLRENYRKLKIENTRLFSDLVKYKSKT
jgi:hypothetical protein